MSNTKQKSSKTTGSSNELYTMLSTNKNGVADVGSKICTKCNEVKGINDYRLKVVNNKNYYQRILQ